ncbi:2OG-Fe(II) oxygenase [Fusarium mexicanum]|uniref:2OG-Fe(II) oxygenase n=1 Tax=Fusarium mexicanum TaxID=751941 RepID=A0A8H5MNV5_9HYPO|nr:2OG-Fe(II) oxygenase [Fusarium mexicanum]
MLQPQPVIEISDDDDDDASGIEETDWKKKLFASLNAIQAEPKLVCFRSYQEFVNPGLKIGGQQIIPLPLTYHYADIIKELSHSVQGTDNKAQNVWELDRAQFDLINPAWPSCLDRITQEITKELDIENALLSPTKLTLQGLGPVAEQDQRLEQSDHIVDHISVCLPSEHQGGDIGVSLGGRRTTVSTATSSALDLSAIGWISTF